jgi:hypothetical protein
VIDDVFADTRRAALEEAQFAEQIGMLRDRDQAAHPKRQRL